MHLSLIALAVILAGISRLLWSQKIGLRKQGLQPVLSYGLGNGSGNWSERWQRTLSAFLLAPLLLLMTAVAVLCMGTQGQMLGLPVGWIGYLLSLSSLGLAGGLLLWLGWQAGRSLRHLQTCMTLDLGNQPAYVLKTQALFAAQIGFWQSRLVVSEGLLSELTTEQLDAVLTHEQAHAHYRDTFWFFWLGWLRHCTSWLPYTETLWQELLLLRELRADQWAARTVDPLVLAESLLQVVQDTAIAPQDFCAAFGAAAPLDRLEERIDALLADPELANSDATDSRSTTSGLLGIAIAFLPLLSLLFHS